MYIESKKIKVFPSPFRAKEDEGAKSGNLFNPESRMNSEWNLTHLPYRLLDNSVDGFVIEETFSGDTIKTLKLDIKGYYFEYVPSASDSINISSFAKDVYAKVRIDKRNNVDYDGFKYENYSLFNTKLNVSGGEEDVPSNDLLDNYSSGTYSFTGLELVDSKPALPDNGYYYLWIATKKDSTWVIPTESKIKFASTSIANKNTKYNINEKFSTIDLDATNAAINSINSVELIARSSVTTDATNTSSLLVRDNANIASLNVVADSVLNSVNASSLKVFHETTLCDKVTAMDSLNVSGEFNLTDDANISGDVRVKNHCLKIASNAANDVIVMAPSDITLDETNAAIVIDGVNGSIKVEETLKSNTLETKEAKLYSNLKALKIKDPSAEVPEYETTITIDSTNGIDVVGDIKSSNYLHAEAFAIGSENTLTGGKDDYIWAHKLNLKSLDVEADSANVSMVSTGDFSLGVNNFKLNRYGTEDNLMRISNNRIEMCQNSVNIAADSFAISPKNDASNTLVKCTYTPSSTLASESANVNVFGDNFTVSTLHSTRTYLRANNSQINFIPNVYLDGNLCLASSSQIIPGKNVESGESNLNISGNVILSSGSVYRGKLQQTITFNPYNSGGYTFDNLKENNLDVYVPTMRGSTSQVLRGGGIAPTWIEPYKLMEVCKMIGFQGVKVDGSSDYTTNTYIGSSGEHSVKLKPLEDMFTIGVSTLKLGENSRAYLCFESDSETGYDRYYDALVYFNSNHSSGYSLNRNSGVATFYNVPAGSWLNGVEVSTIKGEPFQFTNIVVIYWLRKK